jgi:hypothetical protein
VIDHSPYRPPLLPLILRSMQGPQVSLIDSNPNATPPSPSISQTYSPQRLTALCPPCIPGSCVTLDPPCANDFPSSPGRSTVITCIRDGNGGGELGTRFAQSKAEPRQ